MLQLKVEKREERGKKVSNLRKKGEIPAVFYGRKQESTPVVIAEVEFSKVWKEAGESTIIELTGLGEGRQALIHDVDVDPITGRPRHADLYIFDKDQKVTVHIPIEFEGEAPAVKNLGATLVKVLHELEIEALPKDLPHEILVDVSSLSEIGSQIQIKDLKLPAGVAALGNPEDVVVLTEEVKEEVEEPVAAPDLESIEISEERGKKAEEGEGEGASAEGGGKE